VTEHNPALPPRVQQVIDRAMAKDLSQRYQTMRDFYNDLKLLNRDIQAKTGKYYETTNLVAPRQKRGSWLRDGMMGWLYKRLRPRENTQPSQSPTPTSPTPSDLAMGGGNTPQPPQRSTFPEEIAAASDSHPSVLRTSDKKRTLAILPFKNLSGDSETDFYSFSLADSVITELASLKSLVVRPSSYIARYQNQEVNPQLVGKELAVDAVLISTYLKAGSRFRVTPQLVDIETGEILWSDKIDVDYEDIITIQDKISNHIVRGLAINISEVEKGNLLKATTNNAEAYELYLRGRNAYYKFVSQTLKKEDVDLAIELFQKAIALDERFALAHSGLGMCYVDYVLKTIGGASYYELAEEEFKRALELDTRLVEPQLGLVYASLLKGQKPSARVQIRNLLRIAGNDSNVHSTAADIYRLDGLYKQALSEYGHMLRMNPNDLVIVGYNRARVFMYQQMYAEAIDEIDRCLAVESGHALARVFLGQVYYHRGDIDRAVELLKDVLDNNQAMYGMRPLLAACYSARGDYARANSLITPQVIDAACADPDVAYWLAGAYAVEGARDKAIEWLKKAIELGNENYPWFSININWQRLRDDADYIEIMEGLRRRWEKLQTEFS
jgi:serine/threonine-protein kinase